MLYYSRLNIPDSYYEAAEIDGANILQQEFHITILTKTYLITTIALAYGMRRIESHSYDRDQLRNFSYGYYVV